MEPRVRAPSTRLSTCRPGRCPAVGVIPTGRSSWSRNPTSGGGPQPQPGPGGGASSHAEPAAVDSAVVPAATAQSPAEWFDLAVLNQVTSLPNVQSKIGCSMSLLAARVQRHGRADDRGDGVRQAIAHAIDRAELLTERVRLDAGGAGSGQRPSGREQPARATPHRRRRHRIRSRMSPRRPDSLAAEPATPGSRPGSSGRLGRPLQLKMAVETRTIRGPAEWATLIAAQLDGGRHRGGRRAGGRAKGHVRCGPGQQYDMALVSRTASTFLTSTLALVLRTVGATGTAGPRTGATSTTPRSTSCSSRPPASSTPRRRSLLRADRRRLWTQMVALPLFASRRWWPTACRSRTCSTTPASMGSSGICPPGRP